jgi:tetratricopeptide (TPR) repeat protein
MRSIILFLFVILSVKGFSMTPPDSTTNLFEKGSAAYLISEGKQLFNEENYRMALVKFREALTKDQNSAVATYWLSECHLALGNYDKAKAYIQEALAKDIEVNKDAWNILALCQHRLGELDSAIINYKLALTNLDTYRSKELLVQFHIDQCEFAKVMIKNPIKVIIKPLSKNINSAFEETAPTLSPDGKTFYFVSRRADNKGGGISPGDQRYFEDIYVSVWDEQKKEWSEATNASELIERVNSKGMDAVSYISTDGKTMYITVNTEVLAKPSPKTQISDIFVCKLNNKGTWNSPKPLGKPINTIAFDAAISLTADQSTAYFVSERLGGKGRADIWVSYLKGNTWSKPENVGDSINTSGNETTVFVSPDGQYLFFSSTGHLGMGGYDVFVSKNSGGVWSKPVNLGYPINTVADETHFVYYAQLKRAYYSKFSSDDNGGLGARDIFEVDMTNFTLPK